MDPRLAAELEILRQIYPEELEIKMTQMSVRLRVRCYPLLEEQNMEHHYEYDNPFLTVNFDLPNEYPAVAPQFSLESSHSRIVVGGHLTHISERLNQLHESMAGESCVQDSLELIRSWLFTEVAKKNKHFRKRTHILSDERTVFYDDDDDVQENLMKKSQYTEVTPERFAAWMMAFRAEMKMKQERDPVFMRKKAMLAKASGRMIFNDRSKELANYFDDEKNEDDDEDVDVLREMKGAGEDPEEEVEVDEGIFDGEDGLDDDEEEDFVIDDN